MNVQKLAWLATAALVAAPLAAYADSVTYDFTGTVTSSSGIFAQSVGTTVTGTYTINLGNATSTSGTVGALTSNWQALENNGTSAYVFSDTVSGGSFFYNTPSPGASSSQSYVENFESPPNEYDGYEGQYSAPGTGFESSFTINNGSSAAAYDSSGLPLSFATPVAGSNDNGYVDASSQGEKIGALNYTITSLTEQDPVPLPAAAWLMISGLGGLVGIARRRKPTLSAA